MSWSVCQDDEGNWPAWRIYRPAWIALVAGASGTCPAVTAFSSPFIFYSHSSSPLALPFLLPLSSACFSSLRLSLPPSRSPLPHRLLDPLHSFLPFICPFFGTERLITPPAFPSWSVLGSHGPWNFCAGDPVALRLKQQMYDIMVQAVLDTLATLEIGYFTARCVTAERSA